MLTTLSLVRRIYAGLLMLLAIADTSLQPIVADAQQVTGCIGPLSSISQRLQGVSVDTNRNKIFVTGNQTGQVFEIDAITGNYQLCVTLPVPMGGQVYNMVINSVTGLGYVANQNSSTIDVFDGVGCTNITSIPAGGPADLAVDTTTNTIFFTNLYGGSVQAVDGSTNTIKWTALIGSPQGIVFDPVTQTVYIANRSNTIYVLGAATGNLVTTITTSAGHVDELGINSATNGIYGVDAIDNLVFVINGNTNTQTTHISLPAGSYPAGVAADPASNTIYVIDNGSNDVTVIDGLTNTVREVLTTCINQPEYVAVNPVTGIAYVTNAGSDTVAVISANRDTTPPTITITMPANGSVYTLNQNVSASYSCTDPDSSCTSTGTVANGSPLDTSSAGTKTLTVTATDPAGNTATQSVTYTVAYAVQALYDQTRAVKSGAVYPIKIQINDANGVDVSSSSLIVHAVSVTMASTNA
ncbi:MAG TPA: YncE family protein, partial [Chthonomonadaceae bacterium]|nr:YncE family protein [Chthonomonadaceae bacterium]